MARVGSITSTILVVNIMVTFKNRPPSLLKKVPFRVEAVQSVHGAMRTPYGLLWYRGVGYLGGLLRL